MSHAIWSWTTEEWEACMATSMLQTSDISNKLKIETYQIDNVNQLPISENEENRMSLTRMEANQYSIL